MAWKLFIDDLRTLDYVTTSHDGWLVARSSAEAIELVQLHGPPSYISFDHDLGGDDTAMVFMKWLAQNHFDNVPGYSVHSSNPVGRLNIQAYMDSWKKVRDCSSHA
jgi:hypothetical protein